MMHKNKNPAESESPLRKIIASMNLTWINTGIYLSLLTWTLASIIFSPVCYLVLTKLLAWKKSDTLRKMIWFYGWICSHLMKLFVDIKWPEQPQLPNPCIIVSNHESFFDPYLVSFQPNKNICMAVRNWPFKIPFYGFFMSMAGYINVEDLEFSQIVEQARTALEEKASLMFFPEGTRSTDGKLRRFHSGPFYVSVKTGIPIVALCLSGTHNLLPKNKMLIRPSKIRGKILKPIYPLEYKDHESGHIELRNRVKENMITAIKQLNSMK